MLSDERTQVEEPQNEETTSERKKVMSRRDFLKTSGYVVGGTLAGGLVGSLIGCVKQPTEKEGGTNNNAKKPQGAGGQVDYQDALMFFTTEQFKIVEAATERIFPEDENGPGAKALGVPFFIDHQLAGEWGFNAREYMQPPFHKGESVQGYQGRLRRREIFEIALREMQNFSMTMYKKGFVEITPEQQDEVLSAFETDKVKLTTISPSGFFRLLRSATLEGVYADPLYSGNRNMDGWRMKNYPGGGQMSYANVVDQKFTKIEPKSLRDHLQ